MWSFFLFVCAPMLAPQDLSKPVGQETPPTFAAPLAWLEDRDDPPLVSRRVRCLDVGAAVPRTVLAPVLYSFDTHDTQSVAWAGDHLLVNGPVTDVRDAPNVRLPLHGIDAEGGRARLHDDVSRMTVAQGGAHVLAWRAFGLEWIDVAGVDAPRTLLDREVLGRSALTGAAVDPASGDVFVTVHGIRDGLPSGLWRVATAADGAAPIRVGRGATRLAGVDGGAAWLLQKDGRSSRSPHSLWTAPIDGSAEPRRVVSGLRHDTPVCVSPSGAHVAVTRASDGALIRVRPGGTERGESVLFQGPSPVLSASWSPDGAHVALGTADEEGRPELVVVSSESAEVVWRTPGRRPAWGPRPGPR